jgi:NADPH2:quinone reductase
MAEAQAVRIHQNGGPDVLRVERVEVGAPGPGEVRVRHSAIGLNFIDMHHRTGRYPSPSFPVTLGMEAAGVVEAVGAGVEEVAPGDRVAYAGETPGADCTLRIMPPKRLVRLPDWLDDQTAAAMMLKGLTANYLLRGAYPVQAGETILVHAAAGGVGLILCQRARHLGVTVIGTVSTDAKAAFASEHGCAHPIVYTREDVVARVREITGGAGLPVVYDGVGGTTIEISLQCLRRRGMLVSYGTAGGPIPPFDLFRLNRMGSLYLISAGLADYIFERRELLQRATELFEVVRSGAVRIHVNQRYALAEVARAHRDLEARQTVGSSILLP